MVITKVRRGTRLKKEIRFLGSVLLGSQSSERMFLMRLIYWITYPYYKNKNIWLSYDKLYKGGDCGEYIDRHILTRKDGVKSVYVLNKDALDAKRLKKDKVKAYYFGTLSQKLNFLHASFILSTHSGTHTFNAITNQQIPYLMDLIKADNVCIQHGLTVQQLADVQGYVFNNTKRYYCASKYEIENLSKPIYGYEDKSILRLTGIPRFDGLVNDDRKQILITPTWRTYISMPSSMGQVRPYNPHFKETDYFKLYNNLLKDERLKKVAKETGYKLLYLIHPVITSQIDDYEQGEGIELLRADTCNYEELLTQSSLMLTDYSGVQFDFAYMRKPVVYYHPPKLPPHYKEGGFFYDTMGFGEICTEHEELVDVLCDYMRNNCEVKPEYRDREDDFFAYSDIKTCERIYDDLLEYQRQK
jgi:predicted metallopeptidase